MSQPLTHNCLNCQEPLYHDFKLHYLWQFKKVLFPVLCLSCQQKFDCLEKIYQEKKNGCHLCGLLLSDDATEDALTRKYHHDGQLICYHCKHWRTKYPIELIRHQAIYPHNELIQDWLSSFKDKGDIMLGYIMAEKLGKIYKQYKNYLWVVLPNSKELLEQRQFHATGLLLDFADIPYTCPFNYVGDGKKQTMKEGTERTELIQPFEVNTEEIKEASILVFDDNYTTGTAIIHAKSALAKTYPEKIIKSITISR